MTFRVIDKQTGAEADKIALAGEPWVGDMTSPDEFILMESGELLLAFDDGSVIECPEGRFEVIVEGA
jgi:hypothetical protein